MEKMFEIASRKKYRFDSRVGSILAEDLWDLPLVHDNKANLNSIAKGIAKELRENDVENFVGERSLNTTVLETKLEIVKYIIKVKKDEADARVSDVKNKEQTARIVDIIAKKQDAELEGKTIDELKEMIKK